MIRKIWQIFIKSVIVILILTSTVIILFRFIPLPTSSFMIQNWGTNLFSENSAKLNYEWVPYNKISNSIKLAVIAAEDQKFFTHFGFDIESISKVLDENKKGKRIRGASTITQQTAKNIFLWPGKSFIRKGIEAYFTFLLEVFWSKERILEVYLNIAQFGKNDFGVEAASKKFFNKSANRLTYQNAAMLAAVLPNPKRYIVNSPSTYQNRRIFWIQKQMRQLGESTLSNY